MFVHLLSAAAKCDQFVGNWIVNHLEHPGMREIRLESARRAVADLLSVLRMVPVLTCMQLLPITHIVVVCGSTTP